MRFFANGAFSFRCCNRGRECVGVLHDTRMVGGPERRGVPAEETRDRGGGGGRRIDGELNHREHGLGVYVMMSALLHAVGVEISKNLAMVFSPGLQ